MPSLETQILFRVACHHDCTSKHSVTAGPALRTWRQGGRTPAAVTPQSVIYLEPKVHAALVFTVDLRAIQSKQCQLFDNSPFRHVDLNSKCQMHCNNLKPKDL